MNLDAPPAAIAEMERRMGLSPDVIRFITIRVDAHETEPSIQMRKSDRDDRRDGDRGGFRGDRGGFRGGDRRRLPRRRRWRFRGDRGGGGGRASARDREGAATATARRADRARRAIATTTPPPTDRPRSQES